MAEVRFVGQNTVLYASDKGLAAYDIAGDKVKWTGSMATGIAVSGDGKVAAGIYRDEPECILYDVHSGEVLQKIDLGGRYQPVVFNDIGYNPGDSLLVLSEDGSKLGISLDKGLVRVYDRTDETRTIDISDDDARFSHFEGGFCGDRFMFAASDSQRAEVMILDVNTQAVVYNDADFGVFRVRAGEDGFWVSRDNRVLKYNAETESMEQYFAADSLIRGFCRQADTTIVVTDEGIDTFDGNGVVLSHAESPRTAEIFAAAGDRMILGNSNTDTLQILTYADHADAVCAEYDPEDEHIETRMCADGEHMMLFTNTGFSIYRRNGNRIDRKKLPDPDRIYDQQFRRTGGASTLEVTYYDGTVDVYDAVSGDRKSSEKGEPPDSSLYETLETEHFRIESPLHGHPVIYDKASGRQIAEIDEEAYLSYADEADGSLILRFTTTDLRQYAYIMDGKGNVLGEIPWLCDLDGGKLFLDYQDGSVRQTKIYGLEELLELADARLGES